MNDLNNPLIPEHIGPYYVYLLVDPELDEVFYVGKGAGLRFNAHLNDEVLGNDAITDEEAGAKLARIRAIRHRQPPQEPRVEFARIQIQSSEEALLVEATLIDVLHRHLGKGLTNVVRGMRADLGLISLEELQEQLQTPPLDTNRRAILIKLKWWTPQVDTELPRQGYGYRRWMSDQELYDSTRAWWVASLDRAKPYPYAVMVYQGVTRAVYEINHHAWRQLAVDPRRIAFEATQLREGEVYSDFIGERGKRIPPIRPGGGSVFGSGNPIAYWPR